MLGVDENYRLVISLIFGHFDGLEIVDDFCGYPPAFCFSIDGQLVTEGEARRILADRFSSDEEVDKYLMRRLPVTVRERRVVITSS
ncbi:MAG: hypothetical protein COZ49_02355 [Candidatus Yonathbacteria bacterium CG_4_10_14_3_um_filter_47_65]|uniref:Uncharacterized protein n=2 Tax=Parcubacteria group TaxID=1794811 RepID=A0A2M8D8F8_9BACT|nr:MAG: hypothetical protein AUJ44_00795 [Candidatus Nomurabacteria bacterium CG1_02_47_685]PIP03282.1 MAG: hypothetical protein COX54_04280 [Candidatus Yonathbacteria bacterium CG23_combo_of_CG06-09_8_20_14_all_46_18]PIQ32087.1 MAG: hypothetical protein COW61_02375 [Candidatus Yonathbacteria bacterium CG17_big_fil_post_rev_8_21_14_2_50_46_19]PIX56389.1 MAG: hypothetical protein COZ49_02355 [Candidatus Yonathbacteria bacterium CG_4_10_14_3_um_filter_47_65]PIY57365.1 MAG: hypothetical protein CO